MFSHLILSESPKQPGSHQLPTSQSFPLTGSANKCLCTDTLRCSSRVLHPDLPMCSLPHLLHVSPSRRGLCHLFKTGNHHRPLPLLCSHLSQDLLFYQMFHLHPTSSQNASSVICVVSDMQQEYLSEGRPHLIFSVKVYVSSIQILHSYEISFWIFCNFCCYCIFSITFPN